MTKNKNLAESLIDDYVNLGFGNRLNSTTIASLDGDSEMELDSVDDAESGDIVGLEIITNGLSVSELLYDDPEFNEKLLTEVKSALNL
jgi:hypothetical protein